MISTEGILSIAMGELLRVRCSPLSDGRNRWLRTPMAAMIRPKTTNSALQPAVIPIHVTAGKPRLMPRVEPDIIMVMARPLRCSGTGRVP